MTAVLWLMLGVGAFGVGVVLLLLVVLPETAEALAKQERLAALRALGERGKQRYMGQLTPLGKSTIIVDRRK